MDIQAKVQTSLNLLQTSHVSIHWSPYLIKASYGNIEVWKDGMEKVTITGTNGQSYTFNYGAPKYTPFGTYSLNSVPEQFAEPVLLRLNKLLVSQYGVGV